MKPRRLIWASSALCLLIASCEKPKSTSATSGSGNEKGDALAAERAALEEERMAIERQRLEDERAALENEKAALEAEREARLASREQKADARDLTLDERQRALADRELDLSGRETDLASREAGLSDRELELAGRESLNDWEPEPIYDYQEPVADYGTFYNDLQPYGSWFETPDYGYVYQPTIVVQDNSWRPYTRGRWACTNRGWAWVSDEPFGWACFHYGRWTLINGRGWVWVPGDEWAPSWVTWREGGDCIGWAPLPPETLCYRGRGWNSSVEVDFGIGHGWFTFVRSKNMADPIWRHCLPIGQNNVFIKQTTNITNIHINRDRVVSGGPRFDKLRNQVGRHWQVYQLDTDRFQGLRDQAHRNSRLEGNRLSVFAPSMNTRWNSELKPQRIAAKWDEVKVVRAEGGIKPEWTERFREARQKQKEQAVAWKRDHSAGVEAQKQQLQANREKAVEVQKNYQAKQREIIEARREKMVEKREQRQALKGKALPGAAGGRPGVPEKSAEGEAGVDRSTPAERQRELAERMRESRNRGQAERQTEKPQVTPDRAPRPNGNPAVGGGGDNRRDRQVQPRPQPQKQDQNPPARDREGNDGEVADERGGRQRLEEARLRQQEQVRQRQEENRTRQEENRQRQEEARQNQERSRAEAEEGNRRQRINDARREQQEAAREKEEEARQQQEEQQRQMEDNRRRQQEEASQREEQSRRQAEEGQRRQQQEEMQRRQQEEARQQQEEQARQQEEARKQQEERTRQQQEERARQQEEQRARQEERMREQQDKARQQEEERARRQEEMQRRQEEARQQQEERARQQQEERARQQEQARQQQEERQRQQEENRRQQEEARRQQDERNRKQQEDSQRQRGGR